MEFNLDICEANVLPALCTDYLKFLFLTFVVKYVEKRDFYQVSQMFFVLL